MKTFYSHTKVDENGKKYGSKLLNDHTAGVLLKAQKLTSPTNLGNEITGILDDITKYHDLGKYTPHFQNYLLESGKYDRELKQHAKFGAFVLFEKYQQQGKLFEALLACYVIVHHHSNLFDFAYLKLLTNDINIDNKDIFEQQWFSIKKQGDSYFESIKNDIQDVDLEKFIKFPDGQTFRKGIKTFLENHSKVEVFFTINYLFSLLIEADKLDASESEIYERKPLEVDAVDTFLANRKANELRTKVRQSVIQRLFEIDLEKQKIFTLTAPTGVGKTFTALDVALKLRSRVASLKNAQIIYALPFINIIEQGFEEYQKAVGSQATILAHYQYADVFGEEKRSKSDKYDDTELTYNQKLMALDTWQSDIVITSFVQFFQTLIGYKNKLLKKFSHYANAIIILDEVQTLKLSQLPLLGAMIYYLSKYLNTYIILMTATKPKILELAYKEILQKEGEPPIDFESLELLNDHTNIYESYKRTKIVPFIEDTLKVSESPEIDFITHYFSKVWSDSQSCLIVVNKVNRCIDLYNAIKVYLNENSFQNPVYCLSTNIVPIDRMYIIERIKVDLRYGKKPVLISTQVVEAGVDLNFDMGFRDLGPIDSIVQVAGRINREANPQQPDKSHLPLYILDFGDCDRIYGQITYIQAKNALTGKDEYLESEYLTLVDSYFSRISEKSSFDESKKLFQSIKGLRFDGDNEEQWYYVSDFAIIKENNTTQSIFVLSDEKAEKAKEAYEKLLAKRISKEEFDKNYKRDFHQHIIAVPKYYCEHLENFNATVDNLKITQKDEYDFVTGFIRKTRTNLKFDHETLFF